MTEVLKLDRARSPLSINCAGELVTTELSSSLCSVAPVYTADEDYAFYGVAVIPEIISELLLR